MIGIGTFILSFALSYVGTMVLLRARVTKRFMDVPNQRSSHEIPKPRFGGIAIVGSFAVVLAILFAVAPGMGTFLPLVLGAMIIFGAGVIDDFRSLHPAFRFSAQLLAAGIVVGFGHVVEGIYLPLVGTIDLGVVALPFTVLFIVTSINFFNFVDGIDGLAAGSAFIAAAFIAIIAFMVGHAPLGYLCLAISGSSLGFLQFNIPPSRLFMGDSGSTFLGFCFGLIAVVGDGLAPRIPFFIPVLILSSLYLDAGLTLIMRAIRGEKIFKAHRTHYYQRLLQLGLNHKQVTALEYGLTVMLGISAIVFFKAGGFFPVFLTLCWVAIFTFLILKIRSLERGDRLLWERRTVLVVASDLILIAVAYFGAYFIRTNFRFTDPEGIAVLKAFPVVLVIRSACYYWFGLYRGVWKYTSTPDVLRIIKAVSVGTAIIMTTLVLLYRFTAIPRSLFVIEFFLLIIAIGGVRFAARLFHEFGKESLGGGGRRIGIIGAGDRGERLGREIRSLEGKSVSVVCYIDDDSAKDGLILQGVPIRGPVTKLPEICEKYDLNSLVLGISNPSETELKTIVRAARDAGIPIETRDGTYRPQSEPATVLFERLSWALGRALPREAHEKTVKFFEGKRVVVTNGGGRVGPSLVEELASAGAKVTVQVASTFETERFQGKGADVYVGSIERDIDAARLLRATDPDVVIHCTELEVGNVVNARNLLWQRLVGSTDALCKTVPDHGVSSFLLVACYERAQMDSYAASLSAVGETMVLNYPDMLAASPKVLRLPVVLLEQDARRIVDRLVTDRGDASYALIQNEAVSVIMNLAASPRTRALVTPRTRVFFTASDIEKALQTGEKFAHTEIDITAEIKAPLFPLENTKPSVILGVREITSPIYPADDGLVAGAAHCVGLSEEERVEGAMSTIRSALIESPKPQMRVR